MNFKLKKRTFLISLIILVISFIFSIFIAYIQGKESGKKNFYQNVGHITYIKNENITLTKKLFEDELESSLLLNQNDQKKIYAYKINSIEPNIIIDTDGNKKVCYQINYDIKVKNSEITFNTQSNYPKEKINTYWVSQTGKIQKDGWVLNNYKNFELQIDENNHPHLKLQGEG